MKLAGILVAVIFGMLCLSEVVNIGLEVEEKVHSIRERHQPAVFTQFVAPASSSMVVVPPPTQPPDLTPPSDHPPLHFTAGAYTYTIHYTTREFLSLNDCGGYTSFDSHTVWMDINDGTRWGTTDREVLTHELMHIAIHVATDELHLVYTGQNTGKNANHDYIAPAAPSFLEIMQENPKLVAWLSERR